MDGRKLSGYSVLRLQACSVPVWAQRLGVRAVRVNGEVLERSYPRLWYRRREGSRCCSEHDPARAEREAAVEGAMRELSSGGRGVRDGEA